MRIQNSCLKYKKLYNISAVIPLKKGIRKMKKKGQTGKDMEELYQLIEEKIKNAGYPGEIDGSEFYSDVNAEADNQENGTYIFIIKKTEDLFYQGCMEILDDQFDLHYVDIHDGEKVYHVDFDA